MSAETSARLNMQTRWRTRRPREARKMSCQFDSACAVAWLTVVESLSYLQSEAKCLIEAYQQTRHGRPIRVCCTRL